MNRFRDSAANFPPVAGQLQALQRPGHTMLIVPPARAPLGPATRTYVPFECRDMGYHMTEGETPEPDGALFDVHEGNLNEELPDIEDDLGDSPEGWWSFQLDASVTKYLMLEAALSPGSYGVPVGYVTARRLFLTEDPGSYVTEAGDPETGAPPPYAWRRMARLVTDADFNLTIVPYKKGDQTVSIIVSDYTCSTKTLNVVWERSAA